MAPHQKVWQGGKHCIGGLRITVGMVVGLIASGSSRERILQALASPHHRSD